MTLLPRGAGFLVDRPAVRQDHFLAFNLDAFDVVDLLIDELDEAKAVEVSSFRSQRDKEEGLMGTRKATLENLFETIAESETKELNIVVKADVQGSVEVLREAMAAARAVTAAPRRVRINAKVPSLRWLDLFGYVLRMAARGGTALTTARCVPPPAAVAARRCAAESGGDCRGML